MSELIPDARLDLLVVQPTPFCNIACDYCYLPNRDSTQRISPAVLRRTFEQVLPHPIAADGFTVVWHAGEPLVLPIAFYEDAFSLIDQLNRRAAPIAHSFQTNGMLITPPWCEFFQRHHVRLGVSVDGPAFLHDQRRRTRSGNGTHDQVMRGLKCLQQHGVEFHVITVLTANALAHADELFAFYRDSGIRRIGFNIEEIEGVNQRSSLNARSVSRQVRAFMERFADLVDQSPDAPVVREFDGLRQFIAHHPGYLERNQENTPLAIVSVDCEGRVSTFSPELLGLKSEGYGDFIIGNMLTDDLDSMIASSRFQRLARDVRSGIERCRVSCQYFGVCGGGSPSNKYFENGSFDSTETMHCRLHKQVVVDVMLDRQERAAEVKRVAGHIHGSLQVTDD